MLAGQGMHLERETERAALKRALTAAQRGDGAVLMLTGDRGTGRTSLLALARDLATPADMMVVAASCSPDERGFAFGIARRLLARARAEVEPADRLPPFEGRAPGEGAFADLEAVHSAFVGLADRRPLLIAVDDLEACDPESLALLAFVARRIEGSAIALVLAATARSRGGEARPRRRGGRCARSRDPRADRPERGRDGRPARCADRKRAGRGLHGGRPARDRRQSVAGRRASPTRSPPRGSPRRRTRRRGRPSSPRPGSRARSSSASSLTRGR